MNIEVRFYSRDPQIQTMLKAIQEFPEFTSERAECEWFLFNQLARSAARQADYLRSVERKRKRKS